MKIVKLQNLKIFLKRHNLMQQTARKGPEPEHFPLFVLKESLIG